MGFGTHPVVTAARECLPNVVSRLIQPDRLRVDAGVARATENLIDLEIESSDRRYIHAWQQRMQTMTKAERERNPLRPADWEPEFRARCERAHTLVRAAN